MNKQGPDFVERLHLVCSLSDGLRYDIMVRQAELLLELAQSHWVQVVGEARRTAHPWSSLLSEEQMSAYSMIRDGAMTGTPRSKQGGSSRIQERISRARNDVLQQQIEAHQLLRPLIGRSSISDPFTVRLHLSPPLAVSTCVSPETILVLLSTPEPEQLRACRPYGRVFLLDPSPGPMTAIPPAGNRAGLIHLRGAVNAVFDSPRAPAAGKKPILIIGCGDRELDRLLVDWLGKTGVESCVLFDPYLGSSPLTDSDLSQPRFVFSGAVPPAERAELYHSCGAVLLASDDPRQDNHFLCEAAACGLAPLAAVLPGEATGRWSAESVKACVTAWQHEPEQNERPNPAAWSDVVGHLGRSLLEDVPLESRQQIGQYMTVRWSLEEIDDGPPERAAKEKEVLFIVAGFRAEASPKLSRLAAAHDEVYLFAPGKKDPAGELFVEGDLAPVIVKDDAPELVARLLGPGEQARHLTLLFLSVPQPIRVSVVREITRPLGQGAASHTPDRSIMLRQSKPAGFFGAPAAGYVGSQVVSDIIAAGLAASAGEEIGLRWLDLPMECIQVYFRSCETTAAGEDGVVHLQHLPTLLRKGEIDLLYSGDPDIQWSISARNMWASKPIPATGLVFATDNQLVVDQIAPILLSGPTFPFDRYISPTICGARAWRELLAEVEEWLAGHLATRVAYRGEVSVIPFGIDPSPFLGLDRLSCRAAMQLPDESLVLLSVGRFSLFGKADLLPLLLAAKHLVSQGHDITLVLCGGGDMIYAETTSAMAEKLGIGPRVKILTFASEQEKMLLYGAADIFISVVDNPQETYGVVLLEAMAAGLPLVASEWDGYRELVAHEENGFLVPTRWAVPSDEQERLASLAVPRLQNTRDLHESVAVDLPALIQFLETLIDNPELRRKFGAAGQRRVVEEYDTVTQGKRMIELMNEQIDQSRRHPWPSTPAGPQPFVDRLTRRFHHYPTSVITGKERLAPSRESETHHWDGMVLKLMMLREEGEEEFIRQLISMVAERPGTTIDRLSEEITRHSGYNETEIRQRILRCVKYGLLTLESD